MMRIVAVALFAWIGLTACGHADKKFSERYGDRLCDAYSECRPDVVCATDALGDFDVRDCSYDKDAAQECLDGEYRCNTDFGEGYEYIEVPDVCVDVFTECADPLDDLTDDV